MYRLFMILLVFAAPACPQAPDFNLDISVAELAGLVQQVQKKPLPATVAVMDGCREGAAVAGRALHPSLMGRRASEALREALRAPSEEFKTVDHEKLRANLRADAIDPADLCDQRIASWAAGSEGATVFILPKLRQESEQIAIRFDVIRVSDREGVSGHLRRLPADADIIKLLDTAPAKEEQPGVPLEVVRARHPTLVSAGKDGVTFPGCVRCPNPGFTKTAVEGKYQGNVMISLVVSAEAKPDLIHVVKGAPYGLSRDAVKAVEKWRFAPARNREGKPVATWTTIEISLRQY